MAKPEQTPSQELVARAKAEVTITDAGGRKIKLRKPPVLAQFKIVEVVGAEAAKNEVFMAMTMPVIYVAEIDGAAVFMPMKRSELDALIQRLDEDGINAVMAGVQEHFGAVDPEKDKAAIKN